MNNLTVEIVQARVAAAMGDHENLAAVRAMAALCNTRAGRDAALVVLLRDHGRSKNLEPMLTNALFAAIVDPDHERDAKDLLVNLASLRAAITGDAREIITLAQEYPEHKFTRLVAEMIRAGITWTQWRDGVLEVPVAECLAFDK